MVRGPFVLVTLASLGLSCAGSSEPSASAGPAVMVPRPTPLPDETGGRGVGGTDLGKTDVEPAPTIQWEPDERSARHRARRASLPLLIFLHAEWSAASNQVDRTVWSSAEVARRMRGFVAVRVDLGAAEGDAQMQAERYGVRQLPSVVVENVAGDRVAQIEGAFDVERLLAAMEQAYE